MNIVVSKNKTRLGKKAARKAASLIRKAISTKGTSNIILATGASQFEMLEALIEEKIDWSAVTCFHLDEYIGLPQDHPALFKNYLEDRFVNIVRPRKFHFIDGRANVARERKRLHELIIRHPIDVAFAGIGENTHLAFNDPPADFCTNESYLEVTLDEQCRKQQLGEGWFNSLQEVPTKAITMSINRILQSRHIICSVPESRKSRAVKKVVEGLVTPEIPASILQNHPSTYLYLDKESSHLIEI
ncbi:glucosamine-6-phosphate deaminase [Flagellimonas algicola]|uniref:Glucosamine-6-phosphate deaminase n=1 Tax=Flagellimonas algicola TaxID=2583815 RepID=A0ABY2WHT8_9FLAO|nr:glucosamine-6-phosphate deaminase [Allomuricauda algicola]TMU50730.1 glucosamine-6-phosphate deaminase [Allomuricauda algicola]